MFKSFPKTFLDICDPSAWHCVLCKSASGLLVHLHILFHRILCFFIGIIVFRVLYSIYIYICHLEICKSEQIFQSFKNTHPFLQHVDTKNKFFFYIWNLYEGLPTLIEALLFAICETALLTQWVIPLWRLRRFGTFSRSNQIQEYFGDFPIERVG